MAGTAMTASTSTGQRESKPLTTVYQCPTLLQSEAIRAIGANVMAPHQRFGALLLETRKHTVQY